LGAGLGTEVSLKDFRKDIVLELYNEAGQVVLAYKIYRCWVSEYEILPDLDANANAIAIEHITVQNEGWERDQSVKEPVAPSLKKT
jgi:phage tail-like protein